MNPKTGNVVTIDGKKGLIVKNPYDKSNDCQLSPCLAIIDLNGNVIRFIKSEEDLANLLTHEITTGAADDL